MVLLLKSHSTTACVIVRNLLRVHVSSGLPASLPLNSEFLPELYLLSVAGQALQKALRASHLFLFPPDISPCLSVSLVWFRTPPGEHDGLYTFVHALDLHGLLL